MAAERPMLDEVDLEQWRLLLLNTHVPGKPHGELGAAKLTALAERLEQDERPVAIVMHHPPVDVGADWMDAIGLQDRDAFWQLLSAYPRSRSFCLGMPIRLLPSISRWRARR